MVNSHLRMEKTCMFTLPYPIYNIDYNIVDDVKKSRANITYFDLLKLTQQRDLLLKAMKTELQISHQYE